MANDLIPYYRPGQDLTCKAEGAVTGKLCVQVSGPRSSGPGLSDTAEGSVIVAGIPSTTGAAGAGKRVLGVAKYDAADTALFGVVREGVVPITCGAAVTAGAEVEVQTTGKVITLASGIAIGVACTTTAGADVDLMVALY